MKRRIFCLILSALLISSTALGCAKKSEAQSEKTPKETQLSKETDVSVRHVKINIKDYGSVTVELEPQYAPITAGNFLKLAEDKFYDGLTFHRVINGFMMQGGDPLGTGMGGADKTIKGEFSKNGVDNPLSHTRGTISMARSQAMDSASSQFFIVHQDSTFLDGEYAAFGHVTEGMDVVDKICENVEAVDSNGTVAAENQPVIESIEVID